MSAEPRGVVDGGNPTGARITDWFCGICGGSWSQVDGTDPQTHRPGCPNARPDDVKEARRG